MFSTDGLMSRIWNFVSRTCPVGTLVLSKCWMKTRTNLFSNPHALSIAGLAGVGNTTALGES